MIEDSGQNGPAARGPESPWLDKPVCEKGIWDRPPQEGWGSDNINPSHYRSHPSGIECIEITEHMNFNLGNAVKYIWRADLKAKRAEDLRKARWYLDRELERLAGKSLEFELGAA